MKKKLRFYVFLLICFIQLFILSFMFYKGIKKGEIVKIQCRLYDPYDPIKGRYLALSFEIATQKLSDFPNFEKELNLLNKDKLKNTNVFCSYSTFNNNITNIYLKKPSKSNDILIKAKIKSVYNDKIVLDFPFDNYYLQENLAQEAENLLIDQKNKPILVLSINKNGDARIKSLEINGKAIEEIILERNKIKKDN